MSRDMPETRQFEFELRVPETPIFACARTGVLPTWASNKLNSATEQDLESWGEAVLTAPTLDAVFDNDAAH
jgi:hypothetical protein